MDTNPNQDLAKQTGNTVESKKWYHDPIKIGIGFVALAFLTFNGVKEVISFRDKISQIHNATTKTEQQSSGASVSTAEATKLAETTPSTTPEVLPTVESLEIPASLINSPEELTKVFTERLTAWYNAGATKENVQVADKSSHSYEIVAKEDAQKYAGIFTDALFADGWENNSFITPYVNAMTARNSQTLSLFFKTSGKLDRTPYSRTAEYTSPIIFSKKNGDGSIDIVFNGKDTYEEHNRAVELNNGVSPTQGSDAQYTMHLITVDNSLKILSLYSSNITK